MDIIVNDTNIFIDLHSVGLLEKACLLPFEIHTIDFVIGEITDHDQQEAINRLIEDKKIIVGSFSDNEVMRIVAEHSLVARKLSLTDVAVCHYAACGPFTVITGDKNMRHYAESRQLEVRGVLYLFDQMVDNGIIEPKIGAAKLIELRAINSRLPKSAIEARIEHWRQIQ